MEELTNAVRLELLAIGVSPMVLIGALAYWFRERLRQSLAVALSTHTEQLKLAAQRDIESYKVSLIASVERQKAESDLRKAIAIKHATLEYEALIELHSRLGDLPSAIIAVVELAADRTDEQRLEASNKTLKNLERISAAIDSAHLFVALERASALGRLLQQLIDAFNQSLQEVPPPLAPEVRLQILDGVAAERNILRNRVAELVKLASPTPLA